MKFIDSGIKDFLDRKGILLKLVDIKKIETLLSNSGVNKLILNDLTCISIKSIILDNQLIVLKDNKNRIFYSFIHNNKLININKSSQKEAIKELIDYDLYLANKFDLFKNKKIENLKVYEEYLLDCFKQEITPSLSLKEFISNKDNKKFNKQR